MSSLVRLIFEDDDAKTDVTCADDEGYATDPYCGEFRPKDEPDDHTDDDGGNGLDDCSEGDTSETVHFLRVIGQTRSKRASLDNA